MERNEGSESRLAGSYSIRSCSSSYTAKEVSREAVQSGALVKRPGPEQLAPGLSRELEGSQRTLQMSLNAQVLLCCNATKHKAGIVAKGCFVYFERTQKGSRRHLISSLRVVDFPIDGCR